MLHTRRSGFTLIEMLVVIAIIAVLAAILFPVFGRARENARRTVCLSNLQQIGAAIAIYEGDAGGFLPTWSLGQAGRPNLTGPTDKAGPMSLPGATWDTSIGSYLRSKEVTKCRSNPNASVTGGPTPRDARAYSMTQYTQRPVTTILGAESAGCYKDSIPNPVRTVLLFEKGVMAPGAWGDALAQNVCQSHDDDYKSNAADGKMFHFDGKCFLFVDGHAKFYTANSGPFAWDSKRTDTSGIWGSMVAKWSGPGICAKAGRADRLIGGVPEGDWPPAD
jgi:prepilin-type N-terminal cleavage/methylation domain-containing protein